jgi:hypothetical protein
MILGYIIDRLTGESITFRHFEPLTEDGPAAQYDETGVRGRSEPHVFYTQTGEDTWSWDIKLVASVEQRDGGTARQNYQNYLFLKSFQYPDYGENNSGPLKPPPQAIIVFGRFYRKKGIIKNPSFTFSRTIDEDGFPMVIECRFSHRIVNDTPLSFRDVRNGFGNQAF